LQKLIQAEKAKYKEERGGGKIAETKEDEKKGREKGKEDKGKEENVAAKDGGVDLGGVEGGNTLSEVHTQLLEQMKQVVSVFCQINVWHVSTHARTRVHHICKCLRTYICTYIFPWMCSVSHIHIRCQSHVSNLLASTNACVYMCVCTLYLRVYTHTHIKACAHLWCNTLQHTATHCNTLQTLQHTAIHCHTLPNNPPTLPDPQKWHLPVKRSHAVNFHICHMFIPVL